MRDGINRAAPLDFDKEELYESPEDREALLRMPETKREEILYQRHLQVRKFREKKELEEKIAKLESRTSVLDNETEAKNGTESDFVEFSKCMVSRDMLMRNIFKPFFDEFIGHFTRARINGLYVVVKIVKVTKGEPYSLRLSRNEVKTNRYLGVSTGTKVYGNFKIENISNSPLLEEEYEDVWRSFKIGSVAKIREKYMQLVRTMNRGLNDEEITKMVGCRNEVYPKKRSITYLKIDLIQRRDRAIEMKDQKTAMEFQRMIEEIEDNEGNQSYSPSFSLRNRENSE